MHEIQERKKAAEQSRQRENLEAAAKNFQRAINEDSEDKTGPKGENATALERAADKAHRKIRNNWKILLDENNISYVKTFFQEEKRAADWLQNSSEPLFYAVQFGNLDLTEFFVQETGRVNAVRESTHLSLLHTALISSRLNLIQFFLDHPEIDLSKTSIWGENLFHVVFFSGQDGGHRGQSAEKSDKLTILKFLLQPKYFLRTFEMLIAPNRYNETPLDFAKQDDDRKKREIIRLLENKMQQAEQIKDLPEEKREALLLAAQARTEENPEEQPSLKKPEETAKNLSACRLNFSD